MNTDIESNNITITTTTNIINDSKLPSSSKNLMRLLSYIFNFEFYNIKELLQYIIQIEEDYMKNVINCRYKDIIRGKSIIEDYIDTHTSIEFDNVINDVIKNSNYMIDMLKLILVDL